MNFKRHLVPNGIEFGGKNDNNLRLVIHKHKMHTYSHLQKRRPETSDMLFWRLTDGDQEHRFYFTDVIKGNTVVKKKKTPNLNLIRSLLACYGKH